MKRTSDIDQMVERAEEDAGLRRKRPHPSQPPPPQEPERRYVFNGDPQRSTAGYAIRTNRRAVRRRRSTFGIIVTLFAAGVAIVLYISNIIAVNRLAHEVESLRDRYNVIVQANQVLEAEIDKKSALERVSAIATGQLGLREAKDPPQYFDVDDDRVKSINESDE
jgi:cell division protein FtsB